MGSCVTAEYCYVIQPRDDSDVVFYVCKFCSFREEDGGKYVARDMYSMVFHMATKHGFKFDAKCKKGLFH